MNITPGVLGSMIADLQAAALASEQRLNAADAKLGDGDTGSMLLRILNAMNGVNVAGAADLSAAAKALAQATMKETGSSLGTLVITALMSLAKQAQDGAIEPRDMGTVVAGMRDAVAARGKAEDGDKTVLDSLTAIARALDEGPATRDTAARAAWVALDEFRERPCRIGRARMFPERSKAADDPGMLAVALLLDYKGDGKMAIREEFRPSDLKDLCGPEPWRDLTDPRRAVGVEDLEAGLKEPVFENLEIPEQFGPVTVTVDDHKIKRFAFTQDDFNSWTLKASPFGSRRIGHACLLGNDLLQLFTLVYAGSKTVGFHTEEQMWFDSPVYLGERVTLSGAYVEAYERRGQGYVVMEAKAVGEDGRSIVRHRGVEILRTVPGAFAGRGSSAPDRKVSGEVPPNARTVDRFGKDSRPGDVLAPLDKIITAEQAAVFSRIGEYVRNIHNDLAIAREGKLRAPIVQGQQQVGVVGEYLTQAFGEHWLTAGWLRVKFINTLEVFEPIRATALVTNVESIADGTRVELEVWIRRIGDGRLTTVGWATCTVPN